MTKGKNIKKTAATKVAKEKVSVIAAQHKIADNASSNVKNAAQKAKKVVKHALRVTQLKSAIGRQKDQKQTLIGLGLNKLSKGVSVEDTGAIRGMIDKVAHLIKVEKL